MPRSYRARVIDHLHEARNSIAMERSGDIGDDYIRTQVLAELRAIIDGVSQPPPGTPKLDLSTVDTSDLQ